jgi:hypothetical protein
MNEINITPIEQEIAKALSSGGDITAELIKMIKAKDSELTRNRDWENRYQAVMRLVDELDTYLNENWEDLDDHAEPIAEIFALETEKETEISFTISASVTIKHPRGTDLSDIDPSELIDVDVVTVDHRYEVQDYDINRIDLD